MVLLVEEGGLFVINFAVGFLPTAAVENSPVHHWPGYLMRSYPPLLWLWHKGYLPCRQGELQVTRSFIIHCLSLCPETWLSRDLKGRISLMDWKSKSFHFRCFCPLKFAVQDWSGKLCERVLTSFEAVLLSRAKHHALQRKSLAVQD